MRKVIGWLLATIGAFALVLGLLLQFWGADALKVTPKEVDSVTRLTGTTDRLDPSTGETNLMDVKVTSVTQTDTERSDDDVVAWVNTTCVVRDEPGTPDCVDGEDDRLITATIDTFATDRKTALAVNDEKYLADDAVPHEGLINKWPFGAEKKDYPYWDGMLGRAVDAVYTGTENLDGLEVYVYEVTVEDEPAEVVSGIQGLYSAEKTIKVEPMSGQIVYQEQRDVRTLPNGDPLNDLQVAFTDEQLEQGIKDGKDAVSQLTLIGKTVPIAGIIGGLVLLALGIFLIVRDRPEPAGDRAA